MQDEFDPMDIMGMISSPFEQSLNQTLDSFSGQDESFFSLDTGFGEELTETAVQPFFTQEATQFDTVAQQQFFQATPITANEIQVEPQQTQQGFTSKLFDAFEQASQEAPESSTGFNIPTLDVEATSEVIPGVDVEKLREDAPLFKKMIRTIDDVNAYSWARGEMGGLDWGFDQLNTAFEGLNTGVTLFAGGSNVGKSGMLAETGWRIANANKVIDKNHPKKAFVLYFSLDDTVNELVPRVVAIDQKIKINTVRFPKKYAHLDELMRRRDEGLQNLKDAAPYFAMIDSNDGQSIEHIERTMLEYKTFLDTAYPDEYTLVALVDNFHDVGVEAKGYTEENARTDYVAQRLTDISTRFDSPIVCSAEFRKINVMKRPQLDDIKSSGKIIYEAKAILLCHNDVGIKGEQAQIFWELEENGEEKKMPIFECQIAKNKLSSFKGRILYRFTPETSSFDEMLPEEARKYIQVIAS